MFGTRTLPGTPDAIAPDGSEVRVLLGLAGGGMAHFRLPPGETSIAVRHRTVEEIWFVTAGTGEMWRRCAGRETVEAIGRGTCLTVPLGTTFQFRCTGPEALEVVAVTMPPWPGAGEAVLCEGHWPPTCEPGPA